MFAGMWSSGERRRGGPVVAGPRATVGFFLWAGVNGGRFGRFISLLPDAASGGICRSIAQRREAAQTRPPARHSSGGVSLLALPDIGAEDAVHELWALVRGVLPDEL